MAPVSSSEGLAGSGHYLWKTYHHVIYRIGVGVMCLRANVTCLAQQNCTTIFHPPKLPNRCCQCSKRGPHYHHKRTRLGPGKVPSSTPQHSRTAIYSESARTASALTTKKPKQFKHQYHEIHIGGHRPAQVVSLICPAGFKP